VDTVKKSDAGPDEGPPKVLLMAPPPVAKLTEFAEMFEGAEAKSTRFSEHYRRVAEEQGCDFLDTSEVIVSSNIDGIHFEVSEHQKLGKAVADQVRRILA
jgi:lysophospholipase L1-like esterase